jgi:hypothetical protein
LSSNCHQMSSFLAGPLINQWPPQPFTSFFLNLVGRRPSSLRRSSMLCKILCPCVPGLTCRILQILVPGPNPAGWECQKISWVFAYSRGDFPEDRLPCRIWLKSQKL